MVVASLVLGILSVALNLIIGCIPIVGQIICIILGVIAIILGVLGMKKFPDKKGMAVAGMILGIVGTAWGVIALIACAAAGAAAGAMGKDLLRAAEEAAKEATQ